MDTGVRALGKVNELVRKVGRRPRRAGARTRLWKEALGRESGPAGHHARSARNRDNLRRRGRASRMSPRRGGRRPTPGGKAKSYSLSRATPIFFFSFLRANRCSCLNAIVFPRSCATPHSSESGMDEKPGGVYPFGGLYRKSPGEGSLFAFQGAENKCQVSGTLFLREAA